MVLEISCVFHSRTLDMDGLFDDGKLRGSKSGLRQKVG